MKTEINGVVYDTDAAEEIATFCSADADDHLFRTADGRFFLEQGWTEVDGIRLRPDEEPEVIAPELAITEEMLEPESDSTSVMQERGKRIKSRSMIIPLSETEALTWAAKTQMPTCFRGRVLESI